ncbi:MAG: glutamate-1-semialdehyde-2,1-aminomutase [Candidatus Latescibacterota bacterium]|nr:MAG: glutamate-1-semialdehyde-2,1-aminomutase [Candidatus Latescibacterota bacterium]RKY67390.1 MAG: glutamate-1-semialdehyde-2,1-aminomutase [Candidatus Latescibacterota bacterium]
MRSEELFERARRCMPGGVSSPVRAYGAVGGVPRFVERGEGAYIFDVDGNRYIDYVLSYGPLILGHAHPAVLKALTEVLPKGTSFGAPTELEVELAETIKAAFPFVELVRFVNSGTEATMTAVRLARARTGRELILKFEGCYHGHADPFLVRAGSGGLTFNIPSSPGVPKGTTECTISVPYNDRGAVEEVFGRCGEDIAAVVVEPVAGNMGVVLPQEGFLEGLRSTTKEHGALLIFDEVITGFRVEFGGISTRYNIEPDIITLGKVIGGGLPVGALCGREEVMGLLAPQGKVYQAGTLSGNPLAMKAGLATLEVLRKEMPYRMLRSRTEELAEGMRGAFGRKGIPCVVNYDTGMFSIFFTERERVLNLEDVRTSSAELYSKVFHALLGEGVMLAPSPYESAFLSTAHDGEVVERTVEALEGALRHI